jgi:uncharacterized protein YrrD
MTIKASSMGNLPIITLNDGKTISKVRDIIYDGQTNQVKALLIDEKGLYTGAKLLRLQDINAIGKDAVIIENEDSFVYSDAMNDEHITVIVDHDNFMTKNQVITESGTDLGRVTDLYFDFPSGEVLTMEVSKEFIQKLTSGTKNINILDVITISPNNLIVKDFTEEDSKAQVQDQVVNKGMLDINEDAASLVSSAMTKALEFANAAKSRIDDVVHSKTIQGTMDKTKEVATNIAGIVSNTYNDAKDKVESGQAKQHMPDTMDLVDIDVVHIESAEAEADVNGKIHESKKELKNAIKESKEQRKIDIR